MHWSLIWTWQALSSDENKSYCCGEKWIRVYIWSSVSLRWPFLMLRIVNHLTQEGNGSRCQARVSLVKGRCTIDSHLRNSLKSNTVREGMGPKDPRWGVQCDGRKRLILGGALGRASRGAGSSLFVMARKSRKHETTVGTRQLLPLTPQKSNPHIHSLVYVL